MARTTVALLASLCLGCSSSLVDPGSPEDSADIPLNALVKGDFIGYVNPTSLCGFTADNPYPCCQNSWPTAGVYGNCTGGAWQLAKSNGWGSAAPGSLGKSWGDAGKWASVAASAGYIVEPTPSKYAIGVSGTHVATVLSSTSTMVTTRDQGCGYGLPNQWYTVERTITFFNRGFIRAPIPEVTLLLWSGALSMTGSGTFTVSRVNGSVSVSFGFSKLRSNVAIGPSTYKWAIAGTVVSTAGTFSRSFSMAGTYPVSATVTNKLGVSTTAKATLVVR